MNTLGQFIGHFHPVLVHLPIGILLLALLLEVLSRRERHPSLRPSVLPVLLLGAVAAMFSSFSGWLLSQTGDYDNNLVSRHQWLGIGVTIVSFSACWFKARRYPRAFFVCSLLLLPGILLTGHWGISLTHGTDYLAGSSPETEDETAAVVADVPDVNVSNAPASAVADLQTAGVVVLPVARNQPFLSLNFINVPEITPAILQALPAIRKNIIWLKLPGTTLNESGWSQIATFENVTRLSLEHTNTTDASLAYLQPLQRLVHLNLVGTRVTPEGMAALAKLPELRKIFLYQTGVVPGDSAELKTMLPLVQLDFGNYQVPALRTDTLILK